MEKNKCNVVMLATNELAQIVKFVDEKKLLVSSLPQIKGEKYHLYITSNDEIKESDYYIDDVNNKGKAFKNNAGIYKDCKKIIATTDPELHKDGVAKLDLEFIEEYVTEYNKGNCIKEVNVEYDCPYNPSMFPDVWNPKLRSDGTIIIHKIQEVFTKEDFFSIIEKFKKEKLPRRNKPYNIDAELNAGFDIFKTWFEQNY